MDLNEFVNTIEELISLNYESLKSKLKTASVHVPVSHGDLLFSHGGRHKRTLGLVSIYKDTSTNDQDYNPMTPPSKTITLEFRLQHIHWGQSRDSIFIEDLFEKIPSINGWT